MPNPSASFITIRKAYTEFFQSMSLFHDNVGWRQTRGEIFDVSCRHGIIFCANSQCKFQVYRGSYEHLAMSSLILKWNKYRTCSMHLPVYPACVCDAEWLIFHCLRLPELIIRVRYHYLIYFTLGIVSP